MNTLRFSGPFTLSQMHEWIVFLLPDVPPRYPYYSFACCACRDVTRRDVCLAFQLSCFSTPDEDVTMAFKNAFVGTQLLVRYKKVRENTVMMVPGV